MSEDIPGPTLLLICAQTLAGEIWRSMLAAPLLWGLAALALILLGRGAAHLAEARGWRAALWMALGLTVWGLLCAFQPSHAGLALGSAPS